MPSKTEETMAFNRKRSAMPLFYCLSYFDMRKELVPNVFRIPLFVANDIHVLCQSFYISTYMKVSDYRIHENNATISKCHLFYKKRKGTIFVFIFF